MDFSTSELPLTAEVSSALCPGFLGGKASPATLTIQLANGPNLVTTVQHLRAHQPLWRLAGESQLADWCRALGATPDDDLIVSVLDVTARQYRVALERKDSRAIGELRARDERLLQ